MPESTCPGSGCIDGPEVNGLCLEHYIEPLIPAARAYRPRTRAPAVVRFLHHTDLSDGPRGCWPYMNSVGPDGWATFFDGGPQGAARWAYEFFVGPIPEGSDVIPTCCTDNCPSRGHGDPHRHCVNPRHLACRGPARYEYVCARCGQLVIRAERAQGNLVYCSRECMKDRVAKTCPVCGKEFSVPRSNDGSYQTCSMACKNKDAVYSSCARCGKRFTPRHGGKWHCSETCRRPPLVIACLGCGKEFRKAPADEGRRFCSRACSRLFQGETRLEATVREAIGHLGIDFEQEYEVGRWSIDFAIPARKIAIEADGDYWHRLVAARDVRRDASLRDAGWTIIRLPEREVYAAPDLEQLIAGRIAEATGLECRALMRPDGTPAASAPKARRPAWKRLRNKSIGDGQRPLWTDGAA